MMNDIREIGGSSFHLWRGKINTKISNFFQKRADKLIKKGTKTIISKPSCKFINHCTLLINFTVNNNEKYQLVHQGKFTPKYKEWRKIVEENETKIVQWESEVQTWEDSDPEKRGSVPVKPVIKKYPLTIEEMFQTILYYQKDWYKKDNL
jgi:hypothetical protein